MLKRICIFIVLSVFTQLTFAQGQKLIAKLVNDKKNTGASFAAFSPLTEDAAPGLLKSQASRTVSKSSILTIDNARIKQLLDTRPEAMNMKVSSAISGDMELELVRVNLFTSDFSVVTDKDEKFDAFDKEVHYRGIVKGNDNTVAAISIFDNKLMGVISLPNEGNLVLAEMEGSNPGHKHVLYRDTDLKVKPAFNCGTEDKPEIKYTREQLFSSPSSAARGAGASCVRIYVETDFNVFQNRGSVANVNSFITGLFNQSAMLYQNEGIPMVLSQIFVWTSASPYNTSSSSAYLSSFQSLRNTFNGDLGHLVGFYGFGGIAAGFTGLCNTNRDFDQCISGLQVPPYPTIPTYSWNVYVFTHEMGHLLGSRHTHACVWNGTSTAIDGCSGFTEGGCPLPGSPAGGGTIMSYCHFNVGINFTLGFGPQPSNVIRNRVFAANCLNACVNQPAVDLYIKDRPADNGTEPNPDNIMWASEDIWVRNANDGGTVHQNPKGGFTNYIYIRVRNRGSLASFSMSNVKLRAYWAKASAALSWPAPWNNTATGCTPPVTMGNTVGSLQIPAIPANGSTVLVFPWNAPLPANYSCFGGDRFHFCLLGRIETTNYSPWGMTFPEVNGQLFNNVKNNNNIAWKNVSVSNPNGGFSRLANANAADDGTEDRAMFIVAGENTTGIKGDIVRMDFNFETKREIAADATLRPKPSAVIQLDKEPVNIFPVAQVQAPIVVGADANEFDDVSPTPYKFININNNVWDYAEVWVDIGALYDTWDKTGVYVEELPDKAPSGRPWIKLQKPTAAITGVRVAADQVQAVTVKITQFAAAVAGGETQFDFDVTIKDPTGKETIGAENFLATLGTVQVAPLKPAGARTAVTNKGEINDADMTVNNTGKSVNITTSIKDPFEANIFDQAGKLVERKKFTGKAVIGGNNLAKGIYLVSIINQRTKEIYKKRIFVD